VSSEERVCEGNEESSTWSFSFDRRVDPVVAAPDQELRRTGDSALLYGSLAVEQLASETSYVTLKP
jgi:hypothetical protein